MVGDDFAKDVAGARDAGGTAGLTSLALPSRGLLRRPAFGLRDGLSIG